jgi:GTP-dependent phosphoenolpyruvate carboxykinase
MYVNDCIRFHTWSRRLVITAQCPVLDPLWDHPDGVPIEAIIFGGRCAAHVNIYAAFLNVYSVWQTSVVPTLHL